jgi:hypothetical protein
MACPSEPNGKIACSRAGGGWARGNYAANVGMVNPKSTAKNGAGAANDQWNPGQRGVMGANESLAIGEIKDGTTNTFLVLEMRTGLAAVDIRGTWALGQCGASAACSFGNNVGGGGGPNTCVEGADDQQDSGGVNSAIGDAKARQECMYQHASNNWQSFPRSSHMSSPIRTASGTRTSHPSPGHCWAHSPHARRPSPPKRVGSSRMDLPNWQRHLGAHAIGANAISSFSGTFCPTRVLLQSPLNWPLRGKLRGSVFYPPHLGRHRTFAIESEPLTGLVETIPFDTILTATSRCRGHPKQAPVCHV